MVAMLVHQGVASGFLADVASSLIGVLRGTGFLILTMAALMAAVVLCGMLRDLAGRARVPRGGGLPATPADEAGRDASPYVHEACTSVEPAGRGERDALAAWDRLEDLRDTRRIATIVLCATAGMCVLFSVVLIPVFAALASRVAAVLRVPPAGAAGPVGGTWEAPVRLGLLLLATAVLVTLVVLRMRWGSREDTLRRRAGDVPVTARESRLLRSGKLDLTDLGAYRATHPTLVEKSVGTFFPPARGDR